MARGGARKGAGRKRGTVSQQTREKRELAAKVAAEGVTPLEVMTTTMRELWNQAQPPQPGAAMNMGKAMQAVVIAEKVAPYIHPRLSAVSAEVDLDAEVKTESVQFFLPENGR